MPNLKKKTNISIKELAKLANVSTATVSRVLNNKDGFSKETADSVKSIASQYGYIPNRAAKSLRTNQSNIVALLLNNSVYDLYPSTVCAIQVRLQQLNYATLLWSMGVNEDTADYSYIKLLQEQNVSGVIYFPQHVMRVENILDTIPEGIPLVCLDRGPISHVTRPDTVFIEPDNMQGGYLAAKALIDMGVRRIGTVMVKSDDMGNESVFYGRYLGYQQAMWKAGIEIDPKWALQVKRSSIDLAYEMALSHFRANPDELCEAYFCGSDLIALGFLRALDELNVPVPERVKVIGFDDIALARDSVHPLSTIAQPFDKMGVMAAEAIVKMIQGKSVDFYHSLVPLELHLRSTT